MPPNDAASPQEIIQEAEGRLKDLSIEASRAEWVRATYISEDTEAVASRATARVIAATVELAKRAARVPGLVPGSETERKLRLLRLSLSLIAPSDPAATEELTGLVASMEGAYARMTYAPTGASTPLDLQALSRILSQSRDPRELEDVWTGWHRVGRGMRPSFVRYVALANQGAREVGFRDTGTMWRSKYEMDPEAFARDCDRVWSQVRPLYLSLHAYVRRRLAETYGAERVPPSGPIPAHLLGNMWAQSWEGIYPLVAPPGAGTGYDLTQILVSRGTTPEEMVKYGERFFDSLGFQPLPSTFWTRSMLTRPRDREVVCHASAWDLDYEEDLRIKMCIEITEDDFQTIHHELGHNYYQRAYRHQPFLFRDSANDGFHEAVGDTIGLSVTPEYLVRIGLLSEAPPVNSDIGLLLVRALEKVAFLPFGLLVDQWRWKVFSGEIPPERYNSAWWELKLQYQGVAPPSHRSEEEFDPGAKFHVAGNVPYMRYFLAHLLQFQFHRALSREAGASGPLHRASIYGDAEAGRRLREMLALGQSRPWPDALEGMTGERTVDGSALLEYFAPLQRWLDEQNRGHPIGW
jgi:peptidyl-dipeptidase A